MMQVLVNSLVRTSELALLAVGLTMVYSVLRFPNFAHVEFAPIGGYLALAASTALGLHLVPAAALAILATGVIAVVCDVAVFSRLRDRPAAVLMIAAFALGIVIRGVIRAIWGPSARLYDIGLQTPMEFLGARVTSIQVGIIAAAVATMLVLHLILSFTRMGIAMRATADNSHLAETSGIPTERVIRGIWLLGGAVAGLSGILLGVDTQLRPMMGFGIIISVFAAVLVGGIGSPYGAMLGAVIVGFAENVGLAINWGPLLGALGLAGDGYVFIPADYKQAIPFAFLILSLLLRPQGLMGGGR